MPVCVPSKAYVVNRSDHTRRQKSTHTLKQRRWLTEKYKIFRVHHDRKTLGLFFPALYEEYFAIWSVTPTAENIQAAGGDTDKAAAGVRKVEEHVRCFCVDQTSSVLIIIMPPAIVPMDAQPHPI